jgi:type IV pilus assembly protein PilB
MIGEIRDFDTASIAMHAALTGHLVLSTLHTNNAIGAIARLLDMGIEPFIINSSLIGVVGQRLIRKICAHCKEEKTVEDAIFEEIDISGPVKVYHGKGCPKCRHTGYYGREGLFELAVITEAIQRLTARKAPESEIRQQAVSEGFRTMRQEGLVKVTQGITTVEEVIRVSTGVE